MLVRDVLEVIDRKVISVEPDDSIGRLADLIIEHKIGAVPVCDAGGGVVGVISERDVIRGLAEIGAGVADLYVHDLMTSDVVACGHEESLDVIKSMMVEGNFRHMLIVEKGELAGIVSMRDIVAQLDAE